MKTRIKIFAGLVFALMIGLYGCGYTTIKKETKSQSPPIVEPPFEWPKVNYNLPSKTPDNFGFRVVLHPNYSNDVLDTFIGTFTKDLVEGDTTVPFQLSREQMDSIYYKMVEIDFFNYRGLQSIEEFNNWRCWEPFSYKVRVDTLTKNIGSIPCGVPYKGRAEALKELNLLIARFIYSSDAYKKLPKPRALKL